MAKAMFKSDAVEDIYELMDVRCTPSSPSPRGTARSGPARGRDQCRLPPGLPGAGCPDDGGNSWDWRIPMVDTMLNQYAPDYLVTPGEVLG
jgi:hypothetical protein